MDNRDNSSNSAFGITSFVLSIIAIVFSFIPIINFLSYLIGLISLIFALIAIIKKKSKGLAIAAVILCVLSFVIASSMNNAVSEALKETSKNIDKITGDSTEEVLKNDAEVTLGEFTVSEGKYGMIDTVMNVTVKNISNEKKSFSIHIEAVDASNNRINEAYVLVSDLAPGQSITEKEFTFVSSDEVEAMKNATFRIIEASAY